MQKGINHGDQVIADALANLFMDDKLQGDAPPEAAADSEGHDPANPPYGSMAWRDMQHDMAMAQGEMDGW